MKKRMFVVMEVKDLPTHGCSDFVEPFNKINPAYRELILKERVMYADEMEVEYPFPGRKEIYFQGVSLSPESNPWEEWIEKAGTILARIDAFHRAEIRNLLRQMPKRS